MRDPANAPTATPVTATLLFCCQQPESAKLEATDQGGIRLWTSLEAAQAACRGRIFVVDPAALEEAPMPDGEGELVTPRLPLDAFRNAQPYRPPKPVTAAGGYVLRANASDFGGEPEVLLIFRRGVWDLPKGKLDPGETIKACALREVREEVGVRSLVVLRSLGTTVHGYMEEELYRVKTTHWFWMQTPERDFTPEAEENIEKVAWMPWSEAREHLGYDTLRAHMDAVASLVLGR